MQQPGGLYTFSPPNTSKSTPGQASAISNRVSDPPTPTAEESSGVDLDEDEGNIPKNMEERSLLSKKLNTTLRDLNAVVVDRNDPNSPLHPLKTFQDLNLKPELLKGEHPIHRSQDSMSFLAKVIVLIEFVFDRYLQYGFSISK